MILPCAFCLEEQKVRERSRGTIVMITKSTLFGEEMLADVCHDNLDTSFIISASQLLYKEAKVVEGLSLDNLKEFSTEKDALTKLRKISQFTVGIFKEIVQDSDNATPIEVAKS